MKRLIYSALLGLALAGCSSSPNETTTAAPSQAVGNEAKSPILPPTPAAELGAAPAVSAAPAGQPPHSIIYQGTLDLAVVDFNQATSSINRLLEQHNAYLGTAHETRADGQHRQEMTTSVPPARFVALVTALGELGHVENKDVCIAAHHGIY